ncbi:MAG: CoA transferase [Acidimicrobiales bacterium]
MDHNARTDAFKDGPLTGIRIIDLSAVISGPFGTAMLADQGADVIMVERADSPDIVRDSGPLLAGSGVSAMFASMNRNKRTIALDLKQDAGRDLLKELVRDADVVVQNFRPGALDRLGVGWSVLSAINPQLIMCSISGFGTDGPYSHRPAFDPIVQSIAAYPSVQCDDDGRPNLVSTAVCDKATSMQVAQSILAALVARANGAGGQHIELAMVDVALHFLWPEAMWGDTYLDHSTDMPNLNEIYKLYRTSDGWAMVYSVATQAHWRNMCTALGRLDLAEDPRFADLQGRVRFGAEVNDEIQAETAVHHRRAGRADGPGRRAGGAGQHPRRHDRGPARAPPRAVGGGRPPGGGPHPHGPLAGSLLGDPGRHPPPRALLRRAHRRDPARRARAQRGGDRRPAQLRRGALTGRFGPGTSAR